MLASHRPGDPSGQRRFGPPESGLPRQNHSLFPVPPTATGSRSNQGGLPRMNDQAGNANAGASQDEDNQEDGEPCPVQ